MSTNNLKKGYNAAQSPAQALYKPPAWMKSIDSADIAPSGANPAISDSVIKPKSGVTHQPSRHEVLYIPSIEYDASAVETRKAQLKHQLELLKERGL